MTEWISIEDRMPKVDQHYLVWVHCDNNNDPSWCCDKVWWDNKRGWLDTNAEDYGGDPMSYIVASKITHWMPLPEPPVVQ